MTTSVLIQQIAELEESGDQIERHSQALIEELRIVLERGASQIREFEHSKRQADEWVKAMWSTVCQQKREQLLMHQRMKEEDLWTDHLQQRTDALVEELRFLEERVREFEGPIGATEKEKQIEEEMMRDLQKIREKRRGAQHVLAINLARRKPLMEAVEDAEHDQEVRERKLLPLQHILGKGIERDEVASIPSMRSMPSGLGAGRGQVAAMQSMRSMPSAQSMRSTPSSPGGRNDQVANMQSMRSMPSAPGGRHDQTVASMQSMRSMASGPGGKV